MSIKIEFMVMVSNSLFSKFGENFKHYFLIFKILREKIHIHTQFKHLIYMIFFPIFNKSSNLYNSNRKD